MTDTKGIKPGPAITPLVNQRAQELGDVAPEQARAVKAPADVDRVESELARPLLEVAKGQQVEGAKDLLTRWIAAQTDWNTLTEGLLAMSNFLRVFGSGEERPELYANILSLEPPPTDRPFDEASLEVKKGELADLGPALRTLERLSESVGKGLLDGSIDIQSSDAEALKGLLIAQNLGLNTDALKVKMSGWNKLTKELNHATVSFEVGVRHMPRDKPTNFWVISGVGKAVEWVKNLRISPQAVEWMKKHDLFKGYPREFFDYFTPPMDADGHRIRGQLSSFEKDIRAVKIDALPDGEIYAGGPIMRLSGPPAAIEFLETNIMRLVTSWTTVSTAASQMAMAAQGKPVAYFGPRRAPGGDTTTTPISEAAAVGGMIVTSDLLEGYLGRPITGTMEHSIVMLLAPVLKHRPSLTFSPEERKDASGFLRAAWKADQPGLSEKELDEKVSAQLEDTLYESRIFSDYSLKYDGVKSVALVDTTHPNVGVAATLLAQKRVWAEKGEGPENNFYAIRIDSGNLLGQGLRFRRLFREQKMEHINILATDGLLPETVGFFEKVEAELKKVSGGKLPASFYELMKHCPSSVASGDGEIAEITRQAERFAAAGGLGKDEVLFRAYGAGEKIADSVSTVGRPGIVYKASQLAFDGEDGQRVKVDLGKTPTPEKATGPNRELVAKFGADGKIEQWAIASPSEVGQLGAGWQRLMRTVFESGQIKMNTALEKGVQHGKNRREQLSEQVRAGGKLPLGMTKQYKDEWLAVVRERDPTRVEEFRAFFDEQWPTVAVSG